MKVYKFGGASVRSAEGVRNLCRIISLSDDKLFIIVSAMGKTTNALEQLTEAIIRQESETIEANLQIIHDYHAGIVSELFGDPGILPFVEKLFEELNSKALGETDTEDYDRLYDGIVSYGELISTTIISEYLALSGIGNRWMDMRKVFITDSRHRMADVDLELSAAAINRTLSGDSNNVYIGQGFIGGTSDGEPTTLGREGSDYSAAVAAYLLDAESVTIWKDVPGILNADPKLFPDTVLIPELTYLDAVELAYSGAQIIHPKTIKPLQNKSIPLYVKPFSDPSARGSVIKSEIASPVSVPVLILKQKQVLLSIRPQDFSFVLEERLTGIFSLLEKYNAKINLIQSSAVNLTVCIDHNRKLDRIIGELTEDGFRTVYNDGMELLTIRGYDSEICSRYTASDDAYLLQKTRKILRIVRKSD